MFTQLGQNKSLTQQVEEQLTTAIRKGAYSPGEKIPTESELCNMFNVSRTSVREAVKKMVARGIIEVKKGSGAFVSEMSVKNTTELLNTFFELSSTNDVVLQTIRVRQMIEPALARHAANLRTDDHIIMLKNNIDKISECDLKNKEKEVDLDNDFHRLILSISKNDILELLLSPIFSLMSKYKSDVFAKPADGDLLKDKNIMLNHHKNIMDAIANKDEMGAFNAMVAHLEETHNNYMKFSKEYKPK